MEREDKRRTRTRALLRDALVSLSLARGYSALTVEDIVAEAGVGRATFYTHFPDKEKLYDHVVHSVIDDLDTRLAPVTDVNDKGFTGKPVDTLFRHAAEHADPYRMILRGEGDGRGLRLLADAWGDRALEVFRARADALGVTPRVDLRVVARAWAGEQTSVLLWWLESAAPRPALDDVIETLVELSRRGRYWASGFDPE